MAVGIVVALTHSAWGAAASISYSIPQNFASSSKRGDGTVSAVAWNQNGTRCLYPYTLGFTNVGQAASSISYEPNSAAPPVLTIYSDGTARALTTLNNLGSDGVYTGYSGTLTSKCVGGAHPGQTCNANSACGVNGACVTCNQNNVCNDATALPAATAPCVIGSCSGGDNPGAPCTGDGDCPNGTCPSSVTFPSGVTTCYMLQKCALGGTGYNQCLSNGAWDTGAGGGPFHSGLAVVKTGSVFLGSTEKIIRSQYGSTGVPFSNCSTNCDGGIDAMQGSTPAQVCESHS
jgi:hypothetical protein